MNGWEGFVNNTYMSVGDGRRVKFWDHVWYGDVTLREAFLNIFILACDRNAIVSDYLLLHEGTPVCDIRYIGLCSMGRRKS